jgi:hypothetical protein
MQFETLNFFYYWRDGFMKCAAEVAMGGMIYIQNFMTIGAGIQVTLRSWLQQLRGRNIGIIDGSDLWNKPLRWLSCWPSLLKFGVGFRAILRYFLNNLRDSNIDITYGRDVWITPLRPPQVAWYAYQVLWRSVQVFSANRGGYGSDTHTHTHTQAHTEKSDLISQIYFVNIRKVD